MYKDEQQVIEALVGLQGLSKNVHWNASGRGFITIHNYLDEVFLDAVSFIDEIAEHMVTTSIGVPSWSGSVKHFPPGSIREGVREVLAALIDIVENIDDTMVSLGDDDAVLTDIYTRLLQRTNQHVWFLRNEL